MKPVVVDKVMDTASRLFFSQGYNLTGLNQLVAEANVSKASLYTHFPSKRDILLAYLDELYKKWFGGLALFTAEMKMPQEKLIGIFDYRIEHHIKSQFGGCAWTKISSEVPKEDKVVFAKIHQFKHDLRAHIFDLVKELNRSKKSLLPDEMLAVNIFLLLQGALVMASVNKNTDALEDAKKIILNLI